uniref:Tr-type G domain-containing protein n=1 Tax=Arcella intermedia TaxID=1963864 RepID=A0A6B2L4H2_9EUKA
MVVVGPPGAGKSYLGGQLMWNLGGIDTRTIEKWKRESEALGWPKNHGFAYLFDRTHHERSSGKTIHFHPPFLVMTRRMRYGTTCPSGDLRYMKSFCSAVGKADLLLLLVSVTTFKNDEEVIINQLKICHSLSLSTQIIIGITKCDLITDKISLEESIKDITVNLSKLIEPYFTLLGFFHTDLNGSNYITKSSSLDSPNILLDLLDNVPLERYKNDLSFTSQSQFLCPVEYSFKIGGIGTVVCGKVISGHLDLMKRPLLKVEGIEEPIAVFSMENHHDSIPSTQPYLYVGLNLKRVMAPQFKRGMILSDTKIESTSWITAKIKAENTFTIRAGATFSFHTAIGSSTCQVDKISADPNIYKDSILQKDGAATLHCRFLKPIYLFPYAKVPNLGTFVISSGSKLYATGTVEFAANQNSFECLYEFWPKFHTCNLDALRAF